MPPTREGNRCPSVRPRVRIRLLIPDRENEEKAIAEAIISAGGGVEGIQLRRRVRGMREAEVTLSIVHELLMKSIHQALGQMPGVALLGTADLNAPEEGAPAASRPGRRNRGTAPAPVTQKEIARRLGLHVSSVSKILNHRSTPAYRGKTVRRVFALAHKMGYPFERLKHDHRRRHPRKIVDLPVEFSVYVAGNTLYDRGTAVLRDVSLSGALLHTLILPGMKLPAGRFIMGIRILKGPLKKTEIRGRPVRFAIQGDTLGLAMEFLNTEESKAKQFISARA